MADRSNDSFLPPRWILSVGAAVGCVALLLALKEMVTLLVIGYALAYIVSPVLDWLERYKIGRSVGFFAVVGIGSIVILVLTLLALPTISAEMEGLVEKAPQYSEYVRSMIVEGADTLKSHLPAKISDKISTQQLLEMAPELGTQWVKTLFGPAEAALVSGYSLTLTLANLLILPFIVFYLVVDWAAIHRHLLTLVPPIHRATVKGLVIRIDQQISSFVSGQLFIGSILTLLYAIGLGGRGIELWFIIAILSGFGNLVPYLGFCVGIVLGSIMSLFTYGTLASLYWVWGIFLLVQGINDWFLTPKVLGERVGLSPLVVLLAIFASGKLLGLLGVVLAIPICAVIRVLGNFLFEWVVESTNPDSPTVIIGEGTE